jgi:hypothetical protein
LQSSGFRFLLVGKQPWGYFMKTEIIAILLSTALASPAVAQTIRPDQEAFRRLYKELVETNTTLSAGSCTLAAERMAARMRAAGFSDSELPCCDPQRQRPKNQANAFACSY